MLIWEIIWGGGGLAGKHFLIPSLIKSPNIRPSPPITLSTMLISQIKK